MPPNTALKKIPVLVGLQFIVTWLDFSRKALKRALRNPGASESDREKPNDKGSILTVKPIWCLQSCLKNCQKATNFLGQRKPRHGKIFQIVVFQLQVVD